MRARNTLRKAHPYGRTQCDEGRLLYSICIYGGGGEGDGRHIIHSFLLFLASACMQHTTVQRRRDTTSATENFCFHIEMIIECSFVFISFRPKWMCAPPKHIRNKIIWTMEAKIRAPDFFCCFCCFVLHFFAVFFLSFCVNEWTKRWEIQFDFFSSAAAGRSVSSPPIYCMRCVHAARYTLIQLNIDYVQREWSRRAQKTEQDSVCDCISVSLSYRYFFRLL